MSADFSKLDRKSQENIMAKMVDSLNEKIDRQTSGILRIIENATLPGTAILNAYSHIAQHNLAIDRLSPLFAKILADTERFVQAVGTDWDDFFEEFGWLETMSLSYAIMLKRKFHAGGKDKVWEELMGFFGSEADKEYILTNVESCVLISPRIRIIGKALDHHKSGDYISSIPLLLTQVEGMLWDYAVFTGYISGESNSRVMLDVKGKPLKNREGRHREAGTREVLRHLFGGDS